MIAAVLASDEDLMRRLQADDIRAFEELYDRYSARAFGLALLICGGFQRAEEAAQDSFLALWRSRMSYDPTRGSARAWLMTVVRHRSIDVTRGRRWDDNLHDYASELDRVQAPGSVAEDVEKHDEAHRLRTALQRLPTVQREVIALAYFGGLTQTQIAAHLQLPVGTVKGRMRLGLHKVGKEINAFGAGPPPPAHAGVAPRAPGPADTDTAQRPVRGLTNGAADDGARRYSVVEQRLRGAVPRGAPTPSPNTVADEPGPGRPEADSEG